MMKIQLSSILPTGQVLSTGERFLLKKLAALRCPSSNRGFKLRLVKDKSDFVRIHGATCLTSLPAFSPWSYSATRSSHSGFVSFRNTAHFTGHFTNQKKGCVCASRGIYCDMLHIFDLQIVPDCLWSTILDIIQESWTLVDLRENYFRWCRENSGLPRATPFHAWVGG